ncbi:MAG TPA: DUF5677 domain-containing protein [Kofleriaceae bacterium]|jgi:hypothetical protein
MTDPNWLLDTARLYVERVKEELAARWQACPLDLTRREIHEVIGALLARQCALAIGIADNAPAWTPDLGGILLRAMADVHITLAWIALKPEERTRQFVLHGLGQEKLLIEHLKARGVDDDYTRSSEAWLNAQRYTWLTEVNVGNWADLSIRDMAQETNLLDFYRLRYSPLSAEAHSMWNHIARFNLRTCTNPLHRYHRVPEVRSFSPNYRVFDSAAEMLAMTFTLVDERLGLKIGVESAAVLLDRRLAEFARARNAESAANEEPADPGLSTDEAG